MVDLSRPSFLAIVLFVTPLFLIRYPFILELIDLLTLFLSEVRVYFLVHIL